LERSFVDYDVSECTTTEFPSACNGAAKYELCLAGRGIGMSFPVLILGLRRLADGGISRPSVA